MTASVCLSALLTQMTVKMMLLCSLFFTQLFEGKTRSHFTLFAL